MRAVIQRVAMARVSVGKEVCAEIGRGLLVLLGVEAADGPEDVDWMAQKIAGMRIFADDEDKMNLAVGQIGGQVIVVSQFTLCGDCRRGRRPSFDSAARPEKAVPLYEGVVAKLRESGLTVGTGRFQEMMMVELVNDGPVTLLLDSHRSF